MKVVKNRLPSGHWYPLRATMLKAAIAQAGLVTPVTLFQHTAAYWRKQPFFHASFHLAGAVMNDEEVFWVGCRAVPADACGEARSWIEAQAIPAFIRWASELERLPDNSTIRREKQKIVLDWQPEPAA